ncbi:MAG: hypothetical protein A2W03_00755 [Candidatus Aminicenantes bacterium RBG_16_63_16]|nr:MAG: hypothetical protein A2W03_00755 [Candidatus Aminicenantes bacterium RBG_16_63_16]
MGASQVFSLRVKGVVSAAGEIQAAAVNEMLRRGLGLVLGTSDAAEGIRGRFEAADRVGIKVNTIGGRRISTRPEVALGLAGCLTRSGIPAKNVLVWDRTNRELKEAGYRLTDDRNGLKIFGTDTAGAGYETEIFSHLNIGSLFSIIQTQFVTASISLAILKDHGLAGVTASLKNYFGTIHNPNKYHDHRCDPYVAELFDADRVKRKHRLSIVDALVVQYHRGPSFHPEWADASGRLFFSADPVAADYAGWQWIEKLRARKGLPSLKEEGREPVYLATAQAMGLGKASPEGVKIIEEEV